MRLPKITFEFSPVFNSSNDIVTISGRVDENSHAHSAVVIDDHALPKGQDYWSAGYCARIGRQGEFEIKLPKPAKVTGHYSMRFCFDNGFVGISQRTEITYRFQNGVFRWKRDKE
jgi:hypothetical protein